MATNYTPLQFNMPNQGLGGNSMANTSFGIPSVSPMMTPDQSTMVANTTGAPSTFDSLSSWGANTFNRGSMFGNATQSGWVQPTTQALGALAQGWLGFQNLDLAKEQLAFQKDAFAKNWGNQVQLTNQQLYDQAQARSIGQTGQGLTQSKDEFIKEQGVS